MNLHFQWTNQLERHGKPYYRLQSVGLQILSCIVNAVNLDPLIFRAPLIGPDNTETNTSLRLHGHQTFLPAYEVIIKWESRETVFGFYLLFGNHDFNGLFSSDANNRWQHFCWKTGRRNRFVTEILSKVSFKSAYPFSCSNNGSIRSTFCIFFVGLFKG